MPLVTYDMPRTARENVTQNTLRGVSTMKFLSVLSSHLSSFQTLLYPSEAASRPSGITFSQQWDVLGPFQIGTREAAWGADPLELYGGFHDLDRSKYQLRSNSVLPTDMSTVKTPRRSRVRWAQMALQDGPGCS
jgi:hypothetical protein